MKKVKNIDVGWSYTSNDGPEHWRTLCDQFAESAKFACQSPIALEEESAETVNSQITFHYEKEEFIEKKFRNTSHFIPPNMEDYVMFKNVAYHLTDTHFRMPSGHLLSGKQYPLEFHLVHMNDVGENLVVDCLFTITGEENHFSEANHPMDWRNGTHQQWFDPSVFLPEERLHCHYIGSLTTPPTKDPVRWFVFNTIQKMGRTFLDEVKEDMSAFNNRPFQPLDGYRIYFSDGQCVEEKRLSIQRMKYVAVIANDGNFRRTVKRLFITQPSLSNSTRELEEELRISLFLRINKNASSTEEEMAFLEQIEKVLVQVELLGNRYRETMTSERFSISSQHYDLLGKVIAKVLRKCGGQYKDFRVFGTMTLKVIEDVKGLHSELGIIYLGEQNSVSIERCLEQTNLAYEVISTFNTHIFLGNHHPLAKQKEIHLEELVPYPQARFNQEGSNFSCLSEDLVEIPEQESVIRTTDRGALVNLLIETNVYASSSGVVAGFTKKEIRLVPLAPALENRICLLFPENRKTSPIGRYSVRELKALFKKEVDTKTFGTKE